VEPDTGISEVPPATFEEEPEEQPAAEALPQFATEDGVQKARTHPEARAFTEKFGADAYRALTIAQL